MKICFKNTAKPYQNQKKLKYEQVYRAASNNLKLRRALELLQESIFTSGLVYNVESSAPRARNVQEQQLTFKISTGLHITADAPPDENARIKLTKRVGGSEMFVL